MNEAPVNPFAVLSDLLDVFAAATGRYQDSRAAYIEHGEPVDLALVQHHAESVIGSAILASQLSRVMDAERHMSYVHPEAAALMSEGIQTTRDCRIAAGMLLLDLQGLTRLPLGAGDPECLAMIAEARAKYEREMIDHA
ncbi:MAG: hypothetical protein ACYCSN_17500 [Acidobacteriaceae bacterium]